MSSIAFPLQGVVNFVIYIRPRYMTVRKLHPELRCFSVLVQAVWNPTGPRKKSNKKAKSWCSCNRILRKFGLFQGEHGGNQYSSAGEVVMGSVFVSNNGHTPSSAAAAAAPLPVPSRSSIPKDNNSKFVMSSVTEDGGKNNSRITFVENSKQHHEQQQQQQHDIVITTESNNKVMFSVAPVSIQDNKESGGDYVLFSKESLKSENQVVSSSSLVVMEDS
jgi:hypothetical protein